MSGELYSGEICDVVDDRAASANEWSSNQRKEQCVKRIGPNYVAFLKAARYANGSPHVLRQAKKTL